MDPRRWPLSIGGEQDLAQSRKAAGSGDAADEQAALRQGIADMDQRSGQIVHGVELAHADKEIKTGDRIRLLLINRVARRHRKTALRQRLAEQGCGITRHQRRAWLALHERQALKHVIGQLGAQELHRRIAVRWCLQPRRAKRTAARIENPGDGGGGHNRRFAASTRPAQQCLPTRRVQCSFGADAETGLRPAR